ncbi:MAG: hypothetical protein LBJ86_02340 [Spirochaetaceae bacterium]|jgi:hypothetical protein|nr:hypothetical protein [Spirochaetaceae bacterium]
MVARFVCAALAVQGVVLSAQESKPSEKDGAFIFPVHIALQTAADGRVVWRPDWPFGIPVDTFGVLDGDGTRRVMSVELDGGGFNLSAGLNDSGALVRFPVFLNGEFCQFEASYDSEGRIGGFTVGADGEDPVEVEFLDYENEDAQPSLARIHGGGEWFFASIRFQNGSTVETWYDAAGNALAVFTTRFAYGLPRSYRAVIRADGETDEAADGNSDRNAVLDFDSMGNATRIDYGDSIFEAVYAGTELRYWKGPAALALQWDGEGRIVRMTGEGTDGAIDYRYEYDVDGQGAWTERREFRMTAELDALIPAAGDSFRRRIEYR